PRVWPWNLPNSIGQALADSSDGGSGGRKFRWRRRWRGPLGCDARRGSRRSRSEVDGGFGSCRIRGPVVVLRGRKVAVVSTRPVTGRVGFGSSGRRRPLAEPSAPTSSG